MNTWATVSRSDDTVATFSSRGPTKYEFAMKPDVAAPGVRIVSLEAAGSFLLTNYSFLHRAGSGNNAYMQLSGTSMAAPMVTGAVALLLQGSPSLSPAQVKLALQTGATYVRDGGLVGAGAGSVNLIASRKIAANGLLSLPTTIIGGILDTSSGASFWDQGTMMDRLYDDHGLRLLGPLDLSKVWNNPSLLRVGDLNLVGLLNPLSVIPAKSLIWGDVATWCYEDKIIWGTQMQSPEGQRIIWGTSYDDERIIWGTSVMTDPDAH